MPGVRVVFLGTGGALNAERYQASVLVEWAGERILLDTGGGLGLIGRLQAVGVDPFSVTRVVLSHRHLDHSGGLEPFLLWVGIGARSMGRPTATLRLHATEKTMQAVRAGWRAVGGSGEEWFPTPLWEHLAPGETIAVGSGGRLSLVEVDHLPAEGGAAGVILDLEDVRVAYSGDTRPCAALAEAARDADLLIHEVGGLDAHAEGTHRPHHSTAGDAGRIAALAGAKRLALFHLPPPGFIVYDALLSEAQRFVAMADVFVAEDGQVVAL